MAYNYQNFSSGEYDLAAFRGPVPGSKAPDFALSLPDGTPARLLDFDGEFLVLEMGSITCPLFQGRRPGMAQLAARFGAVSFAVLYVREAHPGAVMRAHANAADKRANARALTGDDGEARRVLVDDLEGTAHTAYGSYPNSVFIINRHGCVVWFSDWNNAAATGKALEALLAGKPADNRAWFKPVAPNVSLSILRRAGKGATWDFLRSLPGLIWQNLILRNLRLRFGRARVIAPNTRC